MLGEYEITEEDIECCWTYHVQYLAEILNGEYSLKDAREDILSLIGSKYDTRERNSND